MDQFRGYTVAGMFLVNFLGGYEAIHPVLKHNNNYFSYADSIMPSFMFACGFSYHLTALRRRARDGAPAMYRKFIGRSLGLVLVSLMIFGFGHEFKSFDKITPDSLGKFLGELIKADLWEVLAIIGVAQLLIMPVIAAGWKTRFLAMLGFALGHMGLTYLFNFDFVYGRPNWLDPYLNTVGKTCWDGGTFGTLAWAAIMLAGTLAHDIVAGASRPFTAVFKLAAWGTLFMALGYALSCLSLLHDGETPQEPGKVAASPVAFSIDELRSRPVESLLAEPPFVQPPGVDKRPNNYWMMNKRIVTLPFVLFSTGFAVALYGLFVLAFDPGRQGIGLFRTFGQNPLAAYLLHELVEHQIHNLVPKDSPLWFCLVGLVVFYMITYLFVRSLEKQGVYVRL